MDEQELKIWAAPFRAVVAGNKRAEFRDIRDRSFSVGDNIILREWLPNKREYTGDQARITITDISTGFGIPDGFAMLSFKLIQDACPTCHSTDRDTLLLGCREWSKNPWHDEEA